MANLTSADTADNWTMADTALPSSCNWSVNHTFEGINVRSTPSIYVEIIFYPIFLLFCTVGNVLILVVLLTDKAKTSVNVYLICLAVSDLCILWLGLYLYIPEVDEVFFSDEVNVRNSMKFQGIGTWWRETCIQISDWTLIWFSLERLLALIKPQWLGQPGFRRAVLVEAILMILAVLFTLENLVMWYSMMGHDDGVSRKSQLVSPALLQWESNQEKAEIGITIGKWVILAAINISLVALTLRSCHPRKTTSVVNNGSTPLAEHSGLLGQQNTAIVALICVAVYFVTQFPNVVYKILVMASRPPYCTYNFISKASTRPFVYTAVLANYSFNFFLYCLVWRQFRARIRQLLGRVCGLRKPLPVLSQSLSDSLTTLTSKC